MKSLLPHPFLTGFSHLISACLALATLGSEPTILAPLPGGAPSDPPANVPAAEPRIQFATVTHDFGKLMAGEIVKAEFVFTNIGDAMLEITGVHPGCGCTTAADWSRTVPPGGTGVIPLQFNTAHFMGQVAKAATVLSNDKKQPATLLQLKADIWKPIDVNPQNLFFSILQEATNYPPQTVRIISSLDEPLTLSDVRSSNPAFKVELGTNQPGKGYVLTVTPQPPFPQSSIRTVISAQTSCTNIPLVTVSALLNVQPSLVVMPTQILLPPAMSSNALPYSVAIVNNSPTPLKVLDPSLNAPGPGIQLREVIPGKQFTLTITFPPGFEIPDGDIALTARTTNPRHPDIWVPIRKQGARSAPPIKSIPPGPRQPGAAMPAIRRVEGPGN